MAGISDVESMGVLMLRKPYVSTYIQSAIVVESHPVSVPGTQFWSSARVVCTPNCWAVSSVFLL